MAKPTGLTKIQKPHDNSNRGDVDEAAVSRESEAGVKGSGPADSESTTMNSMAPTQDAAPKASATAVTDGKPTGSPGARSAEADLLAVLGSEFEQHLKSTADAFEAASRKWMSLANRLPAADSELDRLRDVEIDRDRLINLYAGEKAMTESLQAELSQVKARETAAVEKAAQLEEVCETIKERAFEIHTALQQSRSNEQKAQDDLLAMESELTELRRVAQEESAARLSADERNAQLQTTVAKLESAEAEIRASFAKISDDNKSMAAQVPQLLADRDTWQKQFSASERENLRMQADRKGANDRIADLENEIRTLRSDLASLTPSQSVLGIGDVPAPAEEAISEVDDLDLAASLERAFSSDVEDEAPDTRTLAARGA